MRFNGFLYKSNILIYLKGVDFMSFKIEQQELIKKYEKWNKYWKDRNEKLFIDGETNILDYADKLKKEYTRAVKTINNEIYKFYGKYAKDNKITVQELHKLLTKEELKDFKSELNDMKSI